jgi:O-antigen ligase
VNLALTLTLIAATLPIAAEYVMALALFCWLFTGGRWRLAVVTARALPPVGHRDRALMERYRELVRPIHWGVLALVGTQVVAALLGSAFSAWGAPLGETLAALAHTVNRLGLQWLVLSSATIAAVRQGWRPGQVAPWTALWLLAHLAYCFVQRATGIDLVHGFGAHLEPSRFAYGVYRISGFMGHPLTLAYNLMLLTLAALASAWVEWAWRPWRWVWIAALAVITLLISGSRFVFIVIVLTLLVTEARRLKRAWRWVLAILAAAGGALWLEGSLVGRIAELFAENVPLTQRFPRLMYWRLHGRMFLDHPLFGVTAVGRPRAAAAYYSAAGSHDNLYIAHNVFLQFLADTGLIGGAGLLALVAGLLVTWRRLGRGAPIGPLVLATLLSGLMQNNLLDSSFLYAFWFLLGLLLAEAALRESHASQPAQRKPPEDLQPPAGGAHPASDLPS